MQIESYMKEAFIHEASDIYIVAGTPATIRVKGSMKFLNDEKLTPDMTKQAVTSVYKMANRSMEKVELGDDDFSLSIVGVGRFRVNVFRQRSSYALVIRTITDAIPNPEAIGIPPTVINLANLKRGIVLFTGTTGSGKSTSLACLIDKINKEQDCHVITIEDPIEYRHTHAKSIVSQREIDSDTESFIVSLRAALRQMPDVILLGEMRDFETISAAITAAETGHLVLSTLHTGGAASTINRIIDVFPQNQQNQVRSQLALTLQAVVSQQLIPSTTGGRVPALEIMIVNPAIRNLIRENKIFQIENILQTSTAEGMMTMDMSLHKLYTSGKISKDNALLYSVDQKALMSRILGARV